MFFFLLSTVDIYFFKLSDDITVYTLKSLTVEIFFHYFVKNITGNGYKINIKYYTQKSIYIIII